MGGHNLEPVKMTLAEAVTMGEAAATALPRVDIALDTMRSHFITIQRSVATQAVAATAAIIDIDDHVGRVLMQTHHAAVGAPKEGTMAYFQARQRLAELQTQLNKVSALVDEVLSSLGSVAGAGEEAAQHLRQGARVFSDYRRSF